MQTEQTRRERAAALASQATSRVSAQAARTPVPPATTRVSIGPRHAASVRSTVRPTVVERTGPGSAATSSTV